MRLCASPSTPESTRCLGSWSTWVATECTFIAPARAAPRWSWSQVRAGPPPTLVGSRPPWPGTAQCAYMTGLVGGGATPPRARRTLPRSRPTCTRCSSVHKFLGPMCWPVTPSAACTSKPSPSSIPTRLPAWSFWTPPPRNRARLCRPGPSRTASSVAHLGGGRLIAQGSYGGLPPHVRGEARANASTATYLRSSIEEFVAANTSMQQAALLTSLDGKPLVVVTADTGNAADWQAKQDHMATLSTNSSHRLAKDTTHESLLYDEVDSAQASQAISDVITAVRTGRPLG